MQFPVHAVIFNDDPLIVMLIFLINGVIMTTSSYADVAIDLNNLIKGTLIN